MISKERREELFDCWRREQNDSWRDDCEESARWREQLSEEEKLLAAEWDREPPEDLIEWYLRTTQEAGSTYKAAGMDTVRVDAGRVVSRMGDTTVTVTKDGIVCQTNHHTQKDPAGR